MKKGSTFLDIGYVYAPYIPMEVTPIIQTTLQPLNPRGDVIKKLLRRAGIRLKSSEIFSPRKGLTTRYAHKQVQPSYFGSVATSGGQEQAGQTISESRSKDLIETDILVHLHRKGNSL